MNIPIYKPYLNKKTLQYAHQALESGWVSSQGEFINLATEKLKEILKVPYLLLLGNGTHACHLMSLALKYKYPNIKDIICSDNSYVASYNGMLFDGNYTLHTVPCALDTWNYDLDALDQKIQELPKAAVLITHNVCSPIDVPKLKQKYPETIFLEDACESLFGKYGDKYTGTASFCSAFSFFANKTLCAGEGGAFICQDEDVYNYIKMVHSQGQGKERFIHPVLGYNYRCNNISAAILYGQLMVLDEILEKKKIIFDRYQEVFSNQTDIIPQTIPDGCESSNWMFGARVVNGNFKEMQKFFDEKGIEIRPMFFPISAHQYLKENEKAIIGDVANAEVLNRECILLPSYPDLTKDELEYIVKCMEEYLTIFRELYGKEK